jgi:protein tyrosine phosphatase (PTP) superfamily phosphohydrolase (DUF442 family)
MKRRLLLKLALTTAMGVAFGCGTTRQAAGPVSNYPPYAGSIPGAAPCDRCRRSAYPPGRIAPTPVLASPGPVTSAFPPAVAPDSYPGPGSVRQGSYSSSAFLDPLGRSLLDPGVHLSAPIPDDPDSARPFTAPMPDAPAVAPVPSILNDKDAALPLPVDVPQFALAKDRVAAGLQPFPDGIAWLQGHGYKTVLHVRAPGEDDSAARRQFEKRGLRYVSLEASPTNLSKDLLEQFDRVTTEDANLPLFVYDKDGGLAGALWYLYFRTVEGTSDEKARSEAVRLGFQPDQNGEHRAMWNAAQNYLSNAK